MKELVRNERFKEQLARAFAQGLSPDDWEHLLFLLQNQDTLPPDYDEHWLHGRWKGYLECHLSGDLLVIYRRTARKITFASIGTHAEMFANQPRSYWKFPKQRPK